MSRAVALVKFEKTGNIYWGCYNGISDSMYNQLIPYNETERYPGFDFFETKDIEESEITDLDNVEIYSDYGRGFFWSKHCKGSETHKCLVNGRLPFMLIDSEDEDEQIYTEKGQPDWVKDIFEKLNPEKV